MCRHPYIRCSHTLNMEADEGPNQQLGIEPHWVAAQGLSEKINAALDHCHFLMGQYKDVFFMSGSIGGYRGSGPPSWKTTKL